MQMRRGLTLIELLVYLTVIAISSALMTAILMVVLRVQSREFASLGVSQELTFLTSKIQRLTREASYVNMTVGAEGTSLDLCMADEANCLENNKAASTQVYYVSGEKALYIREKGGTASRLSSANINVDGFSAVKIENPGGHSVVQVDLTLSNKTDNPQAVFTRRLQTAIARVNAVTFDTLLTPSVTGTLNIGSSNLKWKDGYFSGDVTVGNRLTAGILDIGLLEVDNLKIDSNPGYLQIDVDEGSPPPDCGSGFAGRMIFSTNKSLYICGTNGQWQRFCPPSDMVVEGSEVSCQ